MTLRILSKIGKEFLVACHLIVTSVMNMVHPHLPEGILVVIHGVSMVDGKVVHQREVIKIVVIHNLTWSQVEYSTLMFIFFICKFFYNMD